MQPVQPAFAGESEPSDWLTDADRYLWYAPTKGGLVVRPRFLAEAFLEREPRFYTGTAPD
jgi:hypothetical protein